MALFSNLDFNKACNKIPLFTRSESLYAITDTLPSTPTPPQLNASDTAIQTENVFLIVKEMPKFPCDENLAISNSDCSIASLNKFIYSQMRYPAVARKENIQGKVIVSFTVRTDGSISDVVVERGIGGGCDEEAIRIIKLMPKWLPGKNKGKLVNVKYKLPLSFRLEE